MTHGRGARIFGIASIAGGTCRPFVRDRTAAAATDSAALPRAEAATDSAALPRAEAAVAAAVCPPRPFTCVPPAVVVLKSRSRRHPRRFTARKQQRHRRHDCTGRLSSRQLNKLRSIEDTEADTQVAEAERMCTEAAENAVRKRQADNRPAKKGLRGRAQAVRRTHDNHAGRTTENRNKTRLVPACHRKR